MTNNTTVLHEVDEALRVDKQQREQSVEQSEEGQGREGQGRAEKLGRLLRAMGASVLLAAAATFMVQQWGEVGHVTRCFSFLGFMALLAVAGFFCGMRMKEDKSARTFLALAAAVIPVHFAQLGAMLYSQLLPSGQVMNYPAQLLWQAPSLSSALLVPGVGFMVMIPIALISFTTLARPVAALATGTYLILNLFLLLPTRDPNLIALFSAFMMMIVCAFDNHLHKSSALKTREGLFVRMMMIVPLLMIVGRTFQLYAITQYFCAMLYLLSAAAIFLAGRNYITQRSEGRLCRIFQLSRSLSAG